MSDTAEDEFIQIYRSMARGPIARSAICSSSLMPTSRLPIGISRVNCMDCDPAASQYIIITRSIPDPTIRGTSRGKNVSMLLPIILLWLHCNKWYDGEYLGSSEILNDREAWERSKGQARSTSHVSTTMSCLIVPCLGAVVASCQCRHLLAVYQVANACFQKWHRRCL